MPLEKQELLTLSEHLRSLTVFNGIRVARSLVFSVMFCRIVVCHFVLLPLAIGLSVLIQITVSDYSFCIFKPFFHHVCTLSADKTWNQFIFLSNMQNVYGFVDRYLSFFFWPLYSLFLFDLRILITFCYLQTFFPLKRIMLTVCCYL